MLEAFRDETYGKQNRIVAVVGLAIVVVVVGGLVVAGVNLIVVALGTVAFLTMGYFASRVFVGTMFLGWYGQLTWQSPYLGEERRDKKVERRDSEDKERK
jgi:hypothetical protein